MMEKFDIPVVLFIFKRKKAVEIIKRIREIKPEKTLYFGRSRSKFRRNKAS